MDLIERIKIYDYVRVIKVIPRVHCETANIFVTETVFCVDTKTMCLTATEIHDRNPYEKESKRYRLSVEQNNQTKQYDGMFAHMMYNLCYKKHYKER